MKEFGGYIEFEYFHGNEYHDNAIKLNYQHILGGFKEQQLNNIMDELKYVDETIYKDTMKHINFLIS